MFNDPLKACFSNMKYTYITIQRTRQNCKSIFLNEKISF